MIVVVVVLGIMLAVRLVVVAFALAAAEKMQAPSSFMLVSGVSSPREMCLVGMAQRVLYWTSARLHLQSWTDVRFGVSQAVAP